METGLFIRVAYPQGRALSVGEKGCEHLAERTNSPSFGLFAAQGSTSNNWVINSTIKSIGCFEECEYGEASSNRGRRR